MSFSKTIQSTAKAKKLENAILTASNQRDYLFGVVLMAIAENSNVDIDSKDTVYALACNEIDEVVKLHNKGEFKLNSTMVKFAFAIVEKLVTPVVDLDEHSKYVKQTRTRFSLNK